MDYIITTKTWDENIAECKEEMREGEQLYSDYIEIESEEYTEQALNVIKMQAKGVSGLVKISRGAAYYLTKEESGKHRVGWILYAKGEQYV